MAPSQMDFDGPEDLDRFITQVREALENTGRHSEAQRLARVQNMAFTTSSEWLGELGLAVLDVRRQRELPADIDAMLERIMVRAVRRAWPALSRRRG
jgi:hypothetical protein